MLYCYHLLTDLTPCQQARLEAGVSAPGKYIPQCTAAGEYEIVQCQGTEYCWCVKRNGEELAGTRQRFNQIQQSDCEDGNYIA